MKLAKEWKDFSSKDNEKDLGIQNEAVHVVGKKEYVTKAVSETGGVADFQTRLQGLYGQPEKPDKKRNFSILAKAWNASSPVHEIVEQRLQNEAVYTLGNDDYEDGGNLIMNSGGVDFQARLQGLK